MAGETEGMSKSAKKRANKKAKEAADAAAVAAPPAPAPAAPPQQEPKAKAKAKAEAVIAAPKMPAAPKAEAKAKAESKAKAAAKPAAKSQAKAPVEEEEAPRKKEEPLAYFTMDDGSGGDWEVSTGMTKKQQRQKERKDAEVAAIKAAKDAGCYPGQKQIPGMGPSAVTQPLIPGMAPPTAKAAVSQSVVGAAPAAAAATGTAATEEQAVPKDQKTASVTVPEAKIGIIIGPKGSTINMIKEKTEIKAVDVNGGVITVTGTATAVALAESAIMELAEKGYCSLAFDDFQENFVNAHPDFFPEFIGKKGAVIQAIKKELNVEVKIPEVPKGGPAGKKYKVTVAGKSENVEKAKQVLNDIMMYFHHEVTHPGDAHEELEIESWQYSFLIGPKGSMLRHIQNNFHVRVHIPRETSLNQNVVVVGDAGDVARAKANIEKVLWNAANQVKGRDRSDQADDGWGEEGEEEEWMKQYMFKRR